MGLPTCKDCRDLMEITERVVHGFTCGDLCQTHPDKAEGECLVDAWEAVNEWDAWQDQFKDMLNGRHIPGVDKRLEADR